MSTDVLDRQTAERTERFHGRISVSTANQLEEEFFTFSEGVRAAMRHCIDEAPLAAWPVPEEPVGQDIRNGNVRRFTVRLSATRLEEFETVVGRYHVPNASRALRDAAREILGGDDGSE